MFVIYGYIKAEHLIEQEPYFQQRPFHFDFKAHLALLQAESVTNQMQHIGLFRHILAQWQYFKLWVRQKGQEVPLLNSAPLSPRQK